MFNRSLLRHTALCAGCVLACLAAIARAEVTSIVGGATATVIQFDQQNPVQTDFNQESVPDTKAEPPAVARAKLDRLSTTGDLTASAQAVSAFAQLNQSGDPLPNDVGMDLAAFSNDPDTHWFVEGEAFERRSITLTPADTNGANLLPGALFRAQSRVQISGAMVIACKDPQRDLTGVRVVFSVSVLLRREDGTTTTELSGEVTFAGGPGGVTRVESATGALLGVFLPQLDFTNQVGDLPNVRSLVFLGTLLPYEFEVAIGEKYELELNTRAQLFTTVDGVAAGAVFGLPQEVLGQVFSRVKKDDTGEQVADLIAAQVDTTGAAYANLPPALVNLLAPLSACGLLGAESVGLLACCSIMAFGRYGRRKRSACRG